MLQALKNLFTSPKTRNHQKLKDLVTTTQTIVVAVKSPAYHEIIPLGERGYGVRVYNRQTSQILAEAVESDLDKAKNVALELLTQYNQRGA